jgi:hypothetical protein
VFYLIVGNLECSVVGVEELAVDCSEEVLEEVVVNYFDVLFM